MTQIFKTRRTPRRAGVAGVVLAGALLLGAAPATAGTVDPAATASAETADGYGARATGGAGGEVYLVTSLADAGPGTLRFGAERPGPRVIRFAVSGRIALRKPVRVASNTTIDGRGADVTLVTKGLALHGVRNVVIRDLRFAEGRGRTDDAVQIAAGSRDVWVTHNDFAGGEDGMVDITQGSTDVTVSWNHFTNHEKVLLVDSRLGRNQPARVTVHHNFFDGTGQRHPFVRHARVHAYNNYVRDYRVFGMRSDASAELRSEGNVFEGRTSRAIVSEGRPHGRVASVGDLVARGLRIIQREQAVTFNPAADYPFRVAPADRALTDTITRLAGRT